MENEKKPPITARELSDEEVSRAAGGTFFGLTRESGTEDRTPYQWIGSDDSGKYLCPLCHRPVHRGFLWRYCCDCCGKSWFDESKLERNLESGGWVRTMK